MGGARCNLDPRGGTPQQVVDNDATEKTVSAVYNHAWGARFLSLETPLLKREFSFQQGGIRCEDVLLLTYEERPEGPEDRCK